MMRILFLLFVLSGFCGLLYQVVWLRLAFGAFGIVTPVLSVVVSVFMLGLALGSWWAGRSVEGWVRRTRLSPIIFYAAAEALIGVCAIVVPVAFDAGQGWLLGMGQIDSFRYMALAAAVLSAALLPACVAMGTTFPLMLAFIRREPTDRRSGFSFLYLANVFGASLGAALTPLVLVERLGFRRTLLLAAAINFLIAAISVWVGKRGTSKALEGSPRVQPARGLADPTPLALMTLFVTGFSSMGLEVVWTRAFTPVLGTYVYSFAGILFTYLWATWVGSWLYRRQLAAGTVVQPAKLVGLVAVTSFFPIVLNDPRFDRHEMILALASIFPLCLALGYLTPSLIDRYSQGDPNRAGRAYAINIIGCVLGPLIVGYFLLPGLGARFGMVLLALPFLVLVAMLARSVGSGWRTVITAAGVCLLLASTLVSVSHEEGPKDVAAEVRRDHTATVVSFGEGMHKQLLVNGIGITSQTALTKLMAHMPLAIHGHPGSIAVICFGMGTTYRSALTWDVQTTAVDLSRSVRDAFPYYFLDAPQFMNHPKGRIVIDDGRRFLQRTSDSFDVVTIDPPPPLEAAGSSLLYSKEFYAVLKRRLKQGGLLQQWSPGGDRLIESAIARSLVESFDQVVAFRAFEGEGIHYTASMAPIRIPSADEIAARIPHAARRDLVEWNTGGLADVRSFVMKFLSGKVPIERVLAPDPTIVITDDRPFNEYYLLRRGFRRAQRSLD
jgi:spermidine synthase